MELDVDRQVGYLCDLLNETIQKIRRLDLSLVSIGLKRKLLNVTRTVVQLIREIIHLLRCRIAPGG